MCFTIELNISAIDLTMVRKTILKMLYVQYCTYTIIYVLYISIHSIYLRLYIENRIKLMMKCCCQQRLSEADAQSRALTDQLHRMDSEKRELNNRFSVFYAALRKVVRLLEDGHKSGDLSSSSKFMQPFTTAVGMSSIYSNLSRL